MIVHNTIHVAQTSGLKCMIFGEAGSGKTFLAKTVSDPSATLIINAEMGLLSICDVAIDYVTVTTYNELVKVYEFLKNQQHNGHKYRYVFMDSITEIAECILVSEMALTTNGQQAYGKMQAKILRIMKAFRDLVNLNVYIIAQQESRIENGKTVFGPAFPGQKLSPAAPHIFDQIFAMRVFNENGVVSRYLQCTTDGFYLCKDRTKKLLQLEPAVLWHIEQKSKQITPVAAATQPTGQGAQQ